MDSTGSHEEVGTVTDGPMEWPVPVVTTVDNRPHFLMVTVVDRDVVLVPPPRPFSLSAHSRQLLDEALNDAFRAAEQGDLWS
jgi:hypothetical protein